MKTTVRRSTINTKTMNAKFLSILMMGIVALLALQIVAAQESGTDTIDDSAVTLADPGISADSPLSGIDRALDRVRLAMAFNKERKAKVALDISEERLAELQALKDEKKAAKLEKAQKHHEKALARVEQALENIAVNGDEKKSEEALKKVIALQNKVEAHREK